MGVRRAMEIVMAETNKKEGPLFTFGPLIHNRQVLDLLEAKGAKATDDLSGLETGRIVIRAHGIPPEKHLALEKTGLRVIDATCPKVTRVQAIIRHHTNKGLSAIIVGDRDHAEVIGLMGIVRDLREIECLKRELENRYSFANIIGTGPRMQEIFELIERLSDTNSSVLIQGESGTGKELVARALHHHSPRKNKPFMKINCSALPDPLLESELERAADWARQIAATI